MDVQGLYFGMEERDTLLVKGEVSREFAVI